jgi:hypothetical protein
VLSAVVVLPIAMNGTFAGEALALELTISTFRHIAGPGRDGRRAVGLRVRRFRAGNERVFGRAILD